MGRSARDDDARRRGATIGRGPACRRDAGTPPARLRLAGENRQNCGGAVRDRLYQCRWLAGADARDAVRSPRRAPLRADVGRARLQGTVPAIRGRTPWTARLFEHAGRQCAAEQRWHAALSLRRDAGDVELSAVPRHGRSRAPHRQGRRDRDRRHLEARRVSAGRLCARPGAAAARLLQQLFRSALSVAQARHDRRPRLVAILRRDGELGGDLLFSRTSCWSIRLGQPRAGASASSPSSRTRWRTSGSAIW